MSHWIALQRLDGAPVQPEQRALSEAALPGDRCGVALSEFGSTLLGSTRAADVMVGPTEELSLVGSLRLDNREELANALGRGSPAAGDAADRELLLAAYRTWGTACIRRLVGEFAFALGDPAERRLLIARDALGTCPLYVHRSPTLVLAAPQIRPLLAFPEVSSELNRRRVADYLELLTFDQESTFFEGVDRLPPGHLLVVEDGRGRLERYHSFDPDRELEPRQDGEFADEFRALLTEAVRCRLPQRRTAGALLSGGLDTSSVVCLASGLPGRPLEHAFSAVFDVVPECDEREFMAPVVAATGVHHHLFHADERSPLADWPETLATFEEPAYASSFYLSFGLYDLAREVGVGVLLEGWGGDSVVGYGFERLGELLRGGHWLTLHREVTALARRTGRSRSKLLRRFVRDPLGQALRSRLGGMRRLLGRGGRRELALSETTCREFAGEVELADRVMSHRASLCSPPRNVRSAVHRELESGRFSQGFELLDRTRRWFTLRAAFPFFDRRLIEFCLALPADQRLRDGWTRYVQRRAMQGIVPEPVLRRPWKTNLGPSVLRGLLHFERDTLEELANGEHGRIDEFVDRPTVRYLHARFLAEQNPADALELIKVLGLAQWLARSPDL